MIEDILDISCYDVQIESEYYNNDFDDVAFAEQEVTQEPDDCDILFE